VPVRRVSSYGRICLTDRYEPSLLGPSTGPWTPNAGGLIAKPRR
jgi:hypothetical protein